MIKLYNTSFELQKMWNHTIFLVLVWIIFQIVL